MNVFPGDREALGRAVACGDFKPVFVEEVRVLPLDGNFFGGESRGAIPEGVEDDVIHHSGKHRCGFIVVLLADDDLHDIDQPSALVHAEPELGGVNDDGPLGQGSGEGAPTLKIGADLLNAGLDRRVHLGDGDGAEDPIGVEAVAFLKLPGGLGGDGVVETAIAHGTVDEISGGPEIVSDGGNSGIGVAR